MSVQQNAFAKLRNLASPLKQHLRPYRQIAQRFRAGGLSRQALTLGRTTFSQFGEDQYLAKRFAEQHDGFYVDVGAFHPFAWSNTCLLYHRGWRGVNIEPDPEALELFNRYRPRDLNLQLAVASNPGEVSFARLAEYSHIEDQGSGRSDDGERIVVMAQPLATVLAERLPPGQQIDLLDVDCEGRDLDVLRSNDWQRFRPAVVLAEAHSPELDAELTAFMDSVGYRRVGLFLLTVVFEERALQL
jgi:FkbM family methyltransferase